MSNETRALLRFELLEISKQPTLWIIPALFLVLHVDKLCTLASGSSRTLDDVASNYVILALASGAMLVQRPIKKQLRGTLAFPFTRPVGRMRALAVRLSVLLTMGFVIFGAMGMSALVVQPEPANDTTLKIEGFDTVQRFEEAGYVVSFRDDKMREAYTQWPNTKVERRRQEAELKGVWSPHLVAVLLSFALYISIIFCQLDPGKSRGAFRKIRRMVWSVLAFIPLIIWLGLITKKGSFMAGIVYLHPVLTTLAILAIMLTYGIFMIRRWKGADI